MDTELIPQWVADELVHYIKSPNTVVYYNPIYRDSSSVMRGGTYHLLRYDYGFIKRVATVKRFIEPGDNAWNGVMRAKLAGYETKWGADLTIPAGANPLNRFNEMLVNDDVYSRQIMRWLNRKLLWQHENGRAIDARDLYDALGFCETTRILPIWTHRDRIR